MTAVVLRPAQARDRDQILAWNGDPDVRARSLDPRPIDADQHARWLASRLADPLASLSIALHDGRPIGLVRIERGAAGDPGRISIVLDVRARGHGLGRATIVAACRADGGPIVAEILDDNTTSRACFEAAGFRPAPIASDPIALGPVPRAARRYLWSLPMTSPDPTIADDTAQLTLWRSEFGARYTDRNDVENLARLATWRGLLAGLDVGRAIEVGCNVGWNLRYLRACGVEAWGVEPQRYAIERARRVDPSLTLVPGTAFELPFRDAWFDLAFTSGD